MKSVDVVVVGGGFAGVVAARELSQAGKSVLLVEARDRLGGRTWYRKFEGYDQGVEIGGTWLAPLRQKYVTQELDRYGISTFLSPDAHDFRWVLGGQLRKESFPIPAEEWSEFERGMLQILADSKRLRLYAEPWGTQGLDELDIPFSRYVEQLQLPQISAEFILSWPTFYFGAYPDRLSALHVLALMGAFESASGWYTELADKISGGTRALVDAIVNDSQAEVWLDSPVDAVIDDGSRVKVVLRDQTEVNAETVVMTAPINTWDAIDFSPPLEGAHAAMAQEKQKGESVKTWVLVKNVEDNVFGVGWDSTIKWLQSEYSTEDGMYLCTFASAEKDLDPSDFAAVEKAVHEIIPEAEVLAIDAHDWNKDEFSAGTWMAYGPGQITKYSAGMQAPHGRVYFANSDLANGWVGWIDGALESGLNVAAKVVNQRYAETESVEAL